MNQAAIESTGETAACIFNESDCIVEGTVEVHEARFNDLYRSMLGIQAIAHILAANEVIEEDAAKEPLNGFLVGGLTAAIQALSGMSLNAMEKLAERSNAQRGNDHE